VRMRTAHDAQLGMPKLILPSVQVNMRAGEFPPAEDDGQTYLKISVEPAVAGGGRTPAIRRKTEMRTRYFPENRCPSRHRYCGPDVAAIPDQSDRSIVNHRITPKDRRQRCRKLSNE